MTENINETVDGSVEVAAEVEAENFDLTASLTADLQRLQAEYSIYYHCLHSTFICLYPCKSEVYKQVTTKPYPFSPYK